MNSATEWTSCEPGETLVGWIAAGTAAKTPHPRENDNPDAILRYWHPPNRLANALGKL